MLESCSPILDRAASFEDARSAIIDLQSAMDLDTVWHSSLKLMRQQLPHRSCSLFFGIVDFEPTAAIHHVESPRNPAYIPATSLTISAPYLERHRKVALYTYSQILSEDPDADRRRAEQEPDPEWNEFVHLAFWRDERPEAVFSITRAPDQPGVSSAERGLLEQLHPMLEAGLRRIRSVEERRTRRHAYEACLQRMPVATLLLADDGSLLFATADAAPLCARWNQGLRTAGEQLELPQQALLHFRNQPAEAQSLRLQHPHIPGLSATIERSTRSAAPCYVITLSDEHDETAAQPVRPALQALTPSERRVALLVADGLGNDAVATQMRSSRRTVEFQLNSIYRKLGLSRRTQLARILR